MNAIYSMLYVPFGFLFRILYSFISNYGIALFIFSLFFRLILVPATIKQQKGSGKTTRMQPKLKRIRDKYANLDPATKQQKIQADTNELYQREGYSPMSAAGCLPLFIQMPILIGLYGVIRQPLTYVLDISKEALTALTEAANSLSEAAASTSLYIETEIITNFDKILAKAPELTTRFPEAIEKIQGFDYTIFGINLGSIPSVETFSNFSSSTTEAKLLLLIPILSFATSMATNLLTQMRQKKSNPNMENAQMMGCMMLMMPLMSLWFTFQFPAGMGMYWILSNSFAFLQTLILGRIYAPRKVIARDMVEETIYRRSYEKTKK